MRITLTIPDPIAKRFQAAVPPRKRSRLITTLILGELKKKETALEAACIAANKDKAAAKEIDEWQAFEDEFDE